MEEATHSHALIEVLLLPTVLLAVLALLAAAGALRPAKLSLSLAPPRRVDLSLLDLVMGLAVLLLGASLAQWTLRKLNLDNPQTLSDLRGALAVLLVQVISEGPVVVYLLVRAGQSSDGLRELGVRPRRPGRDAVVALACLIVALPGVMTVGMIADLVSRYYFNTETPTLGHDLLKMLRDADSNAALVAMLCSAVLLAPLLEELIFRGLMQSVLQKYLGPSRWPAILAVSALFVAVHRTNAVPQALPGLFVLSVMLGWVYERTGSLLPGVLLHAGFNAANVAMVMSGLVSEAT